MHESLPPPISSRRWSPETVWLAGIFGASAAMGLVLGGFWLLSYLREEGNSFARGLAGFAVPSFFLVPFFGGCVAAFIWRSLNPTVGDVALHAFYITLLCLVAAAVILREGTICLLIVSPLLYGMILAGGLLGRLWFKSDPGKLQVSLLPLLAIAILGEPFTRSEQSGIVTDELLIHAPPARIWPEVTAFPQIPAAPHFWLFQLGLPYPESTTTTGDFVGADRRCIFSGGAVFKETVAECVPNENLAFDIIESPPDPELLGHLTPQRGQFLLRDNRDGTTTLIGSTRYTLHVRPLWYFDWWTHHIFRAVHLRVMEDVRRRAEAHR